MHRTVDLPGGGWGYLAPPDLGAGPALIVIGDGTGSDRQVEELCDRFAAEGFTALAPDLSRGEPDLDGAVAYLEASEAVRGEGVGVTGIGTGGGLALRLALRRPDDVRACVPYDGLLAADGVGPDWSRLRVPVQGHFAERGGAVTPDDVAALEKGQEVQVFWYDAGHGFSDDTRLEAFEPDSARTAWIRTLDFLRSKLG